MIMYCNWCGKPNPDGSAYCSSCGKVITMGTQQAQSAEQPAEQPVVQPAVQPVVQPTVQPAVQSTVRPTPVYTEPEEDDTEVIEYDSYFRQTWRQLAVEPLVLVTLIAFSLSVVLNFMSINNTFSQIESIFKMIGASSDLGIVKILMIAPSALIAIGMWMLYVDAQDRSDRPIKTTGLTIIMVVEWVALACVALLGLAVLVPSCSALSEMSGRYYSAASTLTQVVAILMLGLVVVIIILFAFIKLIKGMQDAATSCTPNTTCVMGAAVVEFLLAGLMTFAMVFLKTFSFDMILSVAMPILFGSVLIKYKQCMEELHWQLRQND